VFLEELSLKQFGYGIFYLDSVFAAYDWQASFTRSSGINIADGLWKNVVLTFSGGTGILFEWFFGLNSNI